MIEKRWMGLSLYFGLKVFMDARMPVTHKEGDRYPLRPPYQNAKALVVDGLSNKCFPHAGVVDNAF